MKKTKKPLMPPGKRLTVAFVLLVIIAGLLVVTLMSWPIVRPRDESFRQGREAQEDFVPRQSNDFLITVAPDDSEKGMPENPHSVTKQPGRLVVIIDDAGNDLRALERFLEFPGDLSIAVLPHLTHSSATASRTQAAGKEVILHLPLEPLGQENPGPGAVLVSYTPQRIREIIDGDFASVPFARGVNNHMGSLATQDRALMDALFGYLRDKQKYFIDSRTVSSTLGKEYAEKHGVRFAERNYFLDNADDRGSITRVLNESAAYARVHGAAIVIGHMQNGLVLEVLRDNYDDLTASGIEFVTVSEWLGERAGP